MLRAKSLRPIPAIEQKALLSVVKEDAWGRIQGVGTQHLHRSTGYSFCAGKKTTRHLHKRDTRHFFMLLYADLLRSTGRASVVSCPARGRPWKGQLVWAKGPLVHLGVCLIF